MTFLLERLRMVISMSNRDLAIIIKWEFMRSIRNKAFIITTLLVPIIILVASIVPQMFNSKQNLNLVVVDETGDVYSHLAKALQSENLQFSQVFNMTKDQMVKEAAENSKISYLYIPADFFQSKRTFYYFKGLSRIEGNLLHTNLNQIVKNFELKSIGLSAKVINRIEESVKFERIDVEQIDQDNGGQFFISQIISMAFGLILIMTSMMSGGFLLQSIIKEKNDRIVEILLSSVSSRLLLTGKIFSSLLVGFIQTLTFLFVGFLVARFGFQLNIFGYLNWNIVLFLIYGILGLILIYVLYAFLGVLMKEAQSGGQAQPLLIILPVAPFWFAAAIVQNPLGILARILSFIPPFTPATMIMRIGFTNLPTWEIVVTILFLTFFNILMMIFVGKIFKTGLLMYGKNVNFKEAWKWFKQAKA